jgi:hypothetical protein
VKKSFVVVLVCLLIAAIGLMIALGRPQTAILADGSRLQLVGARYGVEDRPLVPIGFWQQLGHAVPERFDKWLPNLLQPSRSSGGSGWHIEVPDRTNVLQIMFIQESDNPFPDQERLGAVIRDTAGTEWHPSAESMSDISGPNDEAVRIHLFRFAAAPRWQQSFAIELHGSQLGKPDPNNVAPLARFQVDNPAPALSPKDWQGASLPTTSVDDQLAVTLKSFGQDESIERKFSPWVWEYDTVESGPSGVVSNVWHQVRAFVWDNHGNNAMNGLPPRTDAVGDAIRATWRVVFELAADHQSQIASNRFVELPPAFFPPAGESTQLFDGPLHHRNVTVEQIQLIGGGTMAFIDGKLTSQTAELPETPGLNRSSSHTQFPDGTIKRRISLQSRHPVLAVGIDGADAGTWFSCRAQNDETGQTQWLDVRTAPSEQPRFSRVVNSGRTIYYSMEKLNPSLEWSFVFGIHPTRQVEFMIDHPSLKPE